MIDMGRGMTHPLIWVMDNEDMGLNVSSPFTINPPLIFLSVPKIFENCPRPVSGEFHICATELYMKNPNTIRSLLSDDDVYKKVSKPLEKISKKSKLRTEIKVVERSPHTTNIRDAYRFWVNVLSN